jgi:hypothetical protein
MESCQPIKRLKDKKKISYPFLRSLHEPVAVIPGNRTQKHRKHTTALFVVGTHYYELKTEHAVGDTTCLTYTIPTPTFFLLVVLKVVVAWPPPAMFQYVTVCTIRYVGIN